MNLRFEFALSELYSSGQNPSGSEAEGGFWKYLGSWVSNGHMMGKSSINGDVLDFDGDISSGNQAWLAGKSPN